jgi:hypothetical protein
LLHTFSQQVIGTFELFEREVAICEKIATEYSRNYYAWTYRGLVYEHRIMSVEEILSQLQKTWSMDEKTCF